MAGTVAGGRKATQTIKERYGDDFYREIGRRGGQNGHWGGFNTMDKEKVRECGRKGGKKSRRRPSSFSMGKDL